MESVAFVANGGIVMAQFKIYGHRAFLEVSSPAISAATHRASIQALGLPEAKRFHRFIPMEPWQFVHPDDRTSRYIIIEVMMFADRTVETKKAFYTSMRRNLQDHCGIEANDIELTITESPRHDWLIRGVPGDELSLNYSVNRVADEIE